MRSASARSASSGSSERNPEVEHAARARHREHEILRETLLRNLHVARHRKPVLQRPARRFHDVVADLVADDGRQA